MCRHALDLLVRWVLTEQGSEVDDVEVGHQVVKAARQAPAPPAQQAHPWIPEHIHHSHVQ